MPPTMRLDQLIEIDSPEALLPRLSEQAELTVLGQDQPALGGHMPLGHTASTVASMSRHPVAKAARGRGYESAAKAESFQVRDVDDPLLDGEI